MAHYSPRETVTELDKYIIGQNDAKKAVAIALRNRWRRHQLPKDLKEEVLPKNILLIGPTGVGKTEIARRLAKLADAPFLKVEATKFTEVGYVGQDVERIIRDLIEIGITMHKDKMRRKVKAKAEIFAEERVLNALIGENASEGTKEKFKKQLRDGALANQEIEIEVEESVNPAMPTIDIPGMPGAQMGMMNLGDIFGKAFGSKRVKKKMRVEDSYEILINEESEKLLDQDKALADAIEDVQQNGIVFIDEIDKITTRSDARSSGEVSREGVQRDLLPLLEGTQVSTKYGIIKTDHILFIASGAFHVAKPSDLLPELQGRLPIRVELRPLTVEDFKRILEEPKASLIKQYKALMATEDFDLDFTKDAIEEIAKISVHVNQNVENIGARRLQTVLEKILEDVSFTASDSPGKKLMIDAKYVKDQVEELSQNTDLSKFIL